MDRAELAGLVLTSLKEVVEAAEGSLGGAGEQTPLIGAGAVLDSMRLVSLIVDLEQRLEDGYGIGVTIADERAMSAKRSPFRTVGSLVDYLQGLLAEAGLTQAGLKQA
jgi:acyl carrier protein